MTPFEGSSSLPNSFSSVAPSPLYLSSFSSFCDPKVERSLTSSAFLSSYILGGNFHPPAIDPPRGKGTEKKGKSFHSFEPFFLSRTAAGSSSFFSFPCSSHVQVYGSSTIDNERRKERGGGGGELRHCSFPFLPPRLLRPRRLMSSDLC